MGQNNRLVGIEYEKQARIYLEQHGYEILECNFYCSFGEIDIVAKHNEYLVFVEVKYRRNLSKGYPLEAVSVQKQKRISKSALYYMKCRGMQDVPIRFDVIGILGRKIELIQNAFDFVL